MHQSVEELTERFARAGISFEAGCGGLSKIVIDTPVAQGELYLHGGHVTRWQPTHHAPVLWMSQRSLFQDGKPIRGGIPICFPWFGPHPAGQADAPAHGLARLSDWQLVGSDVTSDGTATVELQLAVEQFECRLRVGFGARLDVSLTLRLRSDVQAEAAYQVALHTYLTVSDIAQIRISGLESASFIDKMDNGQVQPASGRELTIASECDRVYLDTSAACVLHDPGLARRIVVSKTGAQNIVVWNPWVEKSARMPDFGDDEWPGMVCIETANVAGEFWLKPGEQHIIATRLEVGS